MTDPEFLPKESHFSLPILIKNPSSLATHRKKKGPCKTDVKGKRMKCGAIQKNRISKQLFFYRSSVRVSNSRSPCRFPRDWCLFRGTHKRSGFSTIRLLERLDWVPYWKTNRLELSTETCLPSQHKANPSFIGLTLLFLNWRQVGKSSKEEFDSTLWQRPNRPIWIASTA